MDNDKRLRNETWTVSPDVNGRYSFDAAKLQVMQDIRDEIQKLNALLHCHNFIAIPRKLDAIVKQTKKRKYVRKVKA